MKISLLEFLVAQMSPKKHPTNGEYWKCNNCLKSVEEHFYDQITKRTGDVDGGCLYYRPQTCACGHNWTAHKGFDKSDYTGVAIGACVTSCACTGYDFNKKENLHNNKPAITSLAPLYEKAGVPVHAAEAVCNYCHHRFDNHANNGHCTCNHCVIFEWTCVCGHAGCYHTYSNTPGDINLPIHNLWINAGKCVYSDVDSNTCDCAAATPALIAGINGVTNAPAMKKQDRFARCERCKHSYSLHQKARCLGDFEAVCECAKINFIQPGEPITPAVEVDLYENETIAGYRPKSQKARGIAFLLYHRPNHLAIHNIKTSILWTPGKPIKFNYPIFARPCPLRPRHGFVDSRVIKSEEEFLKLVKEVEATDENVEILIARPIDAIWSGIITPHTLSIGRGNDGATSGQSTTVPTSVDFKTNFKLEGRRDWKEDATPFAEVVARKPLAGDHPTFPELVQLREGPKIPTVPNYIPKKTTVSSVVNTEAFPDLLRWETEMGNLKGRDGVVVCGKGQSLASHYAIHAILNKIPFITDHLPKVGDKLEPIKEQDPTDDDYQRLAGYLAYFSEKRYTTKAHYRRGMDLATIAAGIHSIGYFRDLNDQQARILAYSLIGLVRYASMAGMGEFRHWAKFVDGVEPVLHRPWPDRLADVKPNGGAREAVFARAEKFTTKKHAFALPGLILAFKDKRWGRGRCSFGGPKWRDGMEKAQETLTAIANFMKAPNVLNYGLMAGAANNLMNAVHNGGRLFNKFVSEAIMNVAAESPGIALCNTTTAKLILTKAPILPKNISEIADGLLEQNIDIKKIGYVIDDPKDGTKTIPFDRASAEAAALEAEKKRQEEHAKRMEAWAKAQKVEEEKAAAAQARKLKAFKEQEAKNLEKIKTDPSLVMFKAKMMHEAKGFPEPSHHFHFQSNVKPSPDYHVTELESRSYGWSFNGIFTDKWFEEETMKMGYQKEPSYNEMGGAKTYYRVSLLPKL